MFSPIFFFQDGVEVKPSKGLRIYAMGRKRFLQIMKCRVSDSGTYACDAGDATTSCTVEVYGKGFCLNYPCSSLQHHSCMMLGSNKMVIIWSKQPLFSCFHVQCRRNFAI